MIIIMGHFRIPPERLEEARPAMERVIAATLLEEGCLAYSYAEAVNEAGLIQVSERWETIAHLDAHFASDHMKLWQVERADLGISDRQITRYEVTGSTPL